MDTQPGLGGCRMPVERAGFLTRVPLRKEGMHTHWGADATLLLFCGPPFALLEKEASCPIKEL